MEFTTPSTRIFTPIEISAAAASVVFVIVGVVLCSHCWNKWFGRKGQNANGSLIHGSGNGSDSSMISKSGPGTKVTNDPGYFKVNTAPAVPGEQVVPIDEDDDPTMRGIPDLISTLREGHPPERLVDISRIPSYQFMSVTKCPKNLSIYSYYSPIDESPRASEPLEVTFTDMQAEELNAAIAIVTSFRDLRPCGQQLVASLNKEFGSSWNVIFVVQGLKRGEIWAWRGGDREGAVFGYFMADFHLCEKR